MPHGGYHGNIVGLGQSGTTGGPAGMGGPPPQPKKSTQNVKSLMTSDNAYSTGTDTNKEKSTTAVTFDDDTPREKGLQSNISSKELGQKRLSDALSYKAGKPVTKLDKDGVEIDQRIKYSEFKKRKLQNALDAAYKRLNKKVTKDPTPKKKEKISYSRALMSKMGIPLQTRNYLYDLFIGTPLLSTKRKDNYKPLTIEEFNKNDLNKLKSDVLYTLFQEHGDLKINTPVNFSAFGSYGSPDSLYHTLGDVTAYINEAGEVIVNDFTDYTDTYTITTVNDDGSKSTTTPTTRLEWASLVGKSLDQILNGTLQMDRPLAGGRVNNTFEERKNVSFSSKLTSLSNWFVYEVAKTLASLEGTQESEYPSKISELKKVAPTGLVELNLGKVGEE